MQSITMRLFFLGYPMGNSIKVRTTHVKYFSFIDYLTLYFVLGAEAENFYVQATSVALDQPLAWQVLFH